MVESSIENKYKFGAQMGEGNAVGIRRASLATRVVGVYCCCSATAALVLFLLLLGNYLALLVCLC